MKRTGRTLGGGLSGLMAVLGAVAWLMNVLSSMAADPPRGTGLGGSLLPESEPVSAPDQSGEDRARFRHRLHLPTLRALRRRAASTRKRLAVLGIVVVALCVVGGLIAYFVAGSTAGSYGAAKVGTVNQVTGLTLDTGGITPTANPDVPLTWDTATLSNSGAVDGYMVNRYDGSNLLQTTLASCAGTVTPTNCTENTVPDGTWKYKVQGKYFNWLGNESSQLTVQVDTSAPTIDSTPQTPSANPSPSFSFSHSTFSNFKCRLDGAVSFTTCSSPDALSGLADGSHTFRVEAVDGNSFPTQVASYTWTIDASAPTFTAKPAPVSANPDPSFSFTHSTFLASFQCELDGGGFSSCTSPHALSSLSDGSHTFKVKALDADNEATQVASYTWTVNTSAPTFTAKPASTSANANPSFSFTHTAASYTFKCKLDAGAFAVCTSPHALSSLTDGSHTFVVEAIDADGFIAATTASHTWMVNTTAPSITAKPQSPSANKTPSFNFTHSVGSYTFTCKVDAGSFATCASPNTLSTLSDASHTFTVQAVDADGFPVPTTAAYTWTVNTTAPSITAKPSTASANPNPSFAFSHGVYTSFQCQRDGGGYSVCTSAQAYSGLSDGSHSFDVKALDADSVATSVASYAWTIDTSAPTITAKPSNPSANASPSFSFTHAQGSYTFKCQRDSGGFSACTSPKSYSSLADGAHQFDVEAVDADGVSTAVKTYNWTINTSAPSILTHPNATTTSTSATFTFSHGVYTSFQCDLDGGGFSSCSSPKSYSGPLTDGSHTFKVKAFDSDTVATPFASFTWTVDTVAPSVVVTKVNGNTVSFPFSTNGSVTSIGGTCGTASGDSATVNWSISTRSGSAPCTAGSWTSGAFAAISAAGTYTASVTQTDTAGNSTTDNKSVIIDTTAPSKTTMEMFDTNANGKVDQVVVTFNEALASCTAPCTTGWTLANVPSAGTLNSVTIAGSQATLNIAEGSGAATTAVGSFTVALAVSSGITDAAGNHSSFAAAAPTDKAAPALLTLQMFDNDTDGKVDRVIATFSESLAAYSAGTSPWTLANVPSGGSLNTVTPVSGTTAQLNIAEGGGAADTAVGSFTVALATNANGIRDAAGNLSSFAAQAPADKAGPVAVSITDTNGATDGLIESGDSLIVTFSEPIGSVVGPATIIVENDPNGNPGPNDTLSITGLTNGPRSTGSDAYVTSNSKTVTYTSSTLAKSNANKTITATVAGSCTGDCTAAGQNTTATVFNFAPDPGLTDAAGNAATGVLNVSIRLF